MVIPVYGVTERLSVIGYTNHVMSLEVLAQNPKSKYNIPYTDLKPKINNFLHKKWQQRWNRNTNNKLFQVKPFLGRMESSLPKIMKRTSNNNAIAYWSQ